MLSENDVKHVASLARIHVNPDEIIALQKDIGNILNYVKKLEELDVSQVEATSHVLNLKNVYREDVVKPSLNQQEIMKMSVSSHNGYFKVPKIIE